MIHGGCHKHDVQPLRKESFHKVILYRHSSSKEHFKQNMEEFYNSQTPPSEGPESMSTNTLSNILPTPYFELLGKEEHG